VWKHFGCHKGRGEAGIGGSRSALGDSTVERSLFEDWKEGKERRRGHESRTAIFKFTPG